MKLSDEGLFDRVRRIYEAALEPELRPDVIRVICEDLDADYGLAQIRDKSTYAPLISAAVNADPDGAEQLLVDRRYAHPASRPTI